MDLLILHGLTVTRELWLEDDADAVWVRYSIEGVTTPVISLRLAAADPLSAASMTSRLRTRS